MSRRTFPVAFLALLFGVSLGLGQMTPDQAADMLLNSARKAYNEKNYPFAVARFQGVPRQVSATTRKLRRPATAWPCPCSTAPSATTSAPSSSCNRWPATRTLPEHPFVLYYLGLAQRGLGMRELAQADAKPQEAAAAPRRRQPALRGGRQAVRRRRRRLRRQGQGRPPADAKELPVDLEWAAAPAATRPRCSCALCKTKEAQATAAPFVKDDAAGQEPVPRPRTLLPRLRRASS